MTPPANDPFPEVILGNANRRFSGVTSTMLQVLAHQQDQASLVVLGAWHLPSATPRVRFFTLLRQLRSQQAKGADRCVPRATKQRNDSGPDPAIPCPLHGATPIHLNGPAAPHSVYSLAHEADGQCDLNL